MSFEAPRQLAQHPAWRRMTEEREAREKFRAENPELANAWDEAIDENEWRNAERYRREREREADESLPDRLLDAGVPRRCMETLGARHKTPALESVREFLDGDVTFCLLLGVAGAGKSVAAAWAVGETIRFQRPSMHGWRGRFVRAADLARRSLYDREDQADFESLCSCHLLALDDLGTEQTSSAWQSQLDELIDRRYGDRLKTILTSNLDRDAFKLRYGERISDRIRHDGQVVGAGTESLRRRS